MLRSKKISNELIKDGISEDWDMMQTNSDTLPQKWGGNTCIYLKELAVK